MNILVTGATGFMGSYLVPKLLEQEYQVRVLVRDIEKAKKMYGDKCEIFYGDITQKETLKGCCDQIDVVYHMAALMGHDTPSPEAFKKFRLVNVKGVKNIIYEAQRSNVKRFIYISSTAAMGLQKTTYIDEKTACKPYTPYQVSKREAELLVENMVEKKSFPAIIVRPSMVYGPGFQGDFLTIAKVCKTGFFPKIGMGKNLSPALYITDLVNALVRFVDRGKIGELYILTSSESYSLKETVMIIGKAMRKNVKYIYVPRWLALLGADILERISIWIGKRPIVTKRNILSVSQDRIIDITKVCHDLDYMPEIPLSVGLPETIRFFLREHYL